MTTTLEKELQPPPLPLARGAKGPGVCRLQEWLCLAGNRVRLDGDFGPATQAALRAFQLAEVERCRGAAGSALSPDMRMGTGVLDLLSWQTLVQPMRRAALYEPGLEDPGLSVVAVAQAHLLAQPREVGGQNRGPWVRLYMNGREGPNWPWCSGFATYVVRQALGEVGERWRTFSCDTLAIRAKAQGKFIDAGEMSEGLGPGSLFLIRLDPEDWIHTGIVTRVGAEHFETIEGNTNDEGHREGYEVCARVRAFNERTDFILL
jgi:hypothetical protein